MTKIHNFPYRHLEGLSTGPRNNITLFLVGLFMASNLGINILKSSLSVSGIDLPDTLDFLIFLMLLLPPFRPQAQQIQADIQVWYDHFARHVLTIIGVSSLIIGFILILVSFPWKQYLVLRVRYASDFRLNTSVSNDFIQELYMRFYEKNTVNIPEKFRKWHYPWFEGEEIKGIADMEQINYLNRIIGTFALITGALRLWTGIKDLNNFSSLEFTLWVAVAVLDITIIILSIKFSKRDSEFVITNYRVIFAQEVKQLSGAVGKRYFFISDLNRNDIASFDFRKVTSFSLEYLVSAVGVLYITGVLFFNNLEILAIIFAVLSIFLLAFVYQTYVGFSLKTKSGDTWIMRHQLANPATRLRQFIGSEQGIFTRMLANRLEEKEIINAVQVLRSNQLGLKTQIFEEEIAKNIQNQENGDELAREFDKKYFISKRFSKSKLQKRKRIQLSLEDILLKDEEVVWEKIIPYPLNWKVFTLFVASIVFLLTLPAMLIVSLQFQVDVANYSITTTDLNQGLTGIIFVVAAIEYLVFQLKYFSLRRKSMVITKNRVFYEELVRPPKWLFFLGIFKESYIRESMISQLQIVSSGMYLVGGYHWEKFLEYLKRTISRSIFYFIAFNLSLLIISYWNYLPAATEIFYLIQFVLFMLGVMITWSASNMVVHFIQSWPTLEINAIGIGVNFRLPYLSKNEAEEAQYILWSGVSSIERRELTKRYLSKRWRGKSKKYERLGDTSQGGN